MIFIDLYQKLMLQNQHTNATESEKKSQQITKEWPEEQEENQNMMPQKRQKNSKKDEMVNNVKSQLGAEITTSKSTVFCNKELFNQLYKSRFHFRGKKSNLRGSKHSREVQRQQQGVKTTLPTTVKEMWSQGKTVSSNGLEQVLQNQNNRKQKKYPQLPNSPPSQHDSRTDYPDQVRKSFITQSCATYSFTPGNKTNPKDAVPPTYQTMQELSM